MQYNISSNTCLFSSYPTKNEIFKKYSETFLKSFKTHSDCRRNVKGTNQSLTDWIYENYAVPVITGKVSCCEYPAVNDIPYIWRETLSSFMTVLTSTLTGECHVMKSRVLIILC